MNILSKENKRAKKRGWNQNPPFPHLFSLYPYIINCRHLNLR